MESDYGIVDATVYEDWVNNNNFFFENGGELSFPSKLPITTSAAVVAAAAATTINNNDNNNNNYDISPIMGSSITTTPLTFDAHNDFFDSPLPGSTSPVSFNTSPNLGPTLRFFPDLVAANTSSMIIPIDDEIITTTTTANNLSVTAKLPSSPALNIPWVPDTTTNNVEDFVPDFNNNNNNNNDDDDDDDDDNNNNNNNCTSSSLLPSSTIPSHSPTPTSSSSSSSNNINKGSRKRSLEEIEKDPEKIAAIKRAKNTDAARRSRLRKAMKMESLEKQVSDLKTEKNELQTKIAVMESEKKALEDKNSDKDSRIRMLEQQLAEVHERLIGRS